MASVAVSGTASSERADTTASAATALLSPASQIASTSAVTLDHAPSSTEAADAQDQSVKDEDEDARLFASLVNGIQNGAAAAAAAAAAEAGIAALASSDDNHLLTSTTLANSSYLNAPSSDVTESATNGAEEANEEDPSKPIPAYAKLEFPGFSYYIQTLDFTIGRRPAEFRAQAADELRITGASKLMGDVDVDLGPLKSISRFHVRIFYEDQPAFQPHTGWAHDAAGYSHGGLQEGVRSLSSASSTRAPSSSDDELHLPGSHASGRFVLQVLGRNGACVDDVYVGKGAIVPLGRRTKLQIAERVFYFVLPPPRMVPYATASQLEADSEASLGTSDEEESDEEDSDDDESSSGVNSGSSEGGGSEDGTAQGESTARRKLVLKNRNGAARGKGKGKGAYMDLDGTGAASTLSPAEQKQIAETVSIANRKRKRGEPLDEEEKKALKVGTPIGVEALDLQRRKKKKRSRADDSTSASDTATDAAALGNAGRGKSAGKAAIVAAALAAKAKADAESIQSLAQSSMDVDSTSSGETAPGLVKAGKGPAAEAIAAVSASPANAASPTTSATPMAKKPLPPAGPGVKPDKSNMDLIREAMASHLSTSRGGKMALQEVYEYLTSQYEWCRNNSRANGRDWHSAIRHAIGNAKDMVRIARKEHESGRGVFYAFAGSDAAVADALEQERLAQKEAAGEAASTPPPAQAVASATSVTPAPAASMATTATKSAALAPVMSPAPPVKTAPATPGAAPKVPVTPASMPISIATPRPPNAAPVAPPPTSATTITPVARPPPAAASASPSPRPPPATSAAASPIIAADGRVRIVVGKAPAEALAHMATAPKAAITQSIEALFGGPPIVHHEGTLFLSPIVFGRMSAQEINDIGGKGAQQALATLQAQLVAHLQSKMTTGMGSPSPSPQPPLPPMPASGGASPHNTGQGRPPLSTARPVGTPSPRPALPRPAGPGTTAGRPPINVRPSTATTSASRPPIGVAGATPQRPIDLSSTPASAARPLGAPATSSAVRPVGRPPLNTGARPAGQTVGRPPGPGRPGRPPLHTRPAAPAPSSTIARPAPGSGMGRPPGSAQTATAPSSTIGLARPAGAAPRPTRPPLGTPATTNVARPGVPATTGLGRPALPRPSIAVAATGAGLARPGPGRPPLHAPRPGPGRPPLSARPRSVGPTPAGQQGVRPATAVPAAGATGATSPLGAVPAASVAASTTADVPSLSGVGATPSTTASAAAAAVAVGGGTSQADMAALLAMLTSGKLDSGKLTPAQHELLQRAGRLAAEQQKAQQQKAAAKGSPAPSPTPAKSATATPPPPSAGRPPIRPATPVARPPLGSVARPVSMPGSPSGVRPAIVRPQAGAASGKAASPAASTPAATASPPPSKPSTEESKGE